MTSAELKTAKQDPLIDYLNDKHAGETSCVPVHAPNLFKPDPVLDRRYGEWEGWVRRWIKWGQ